MRIPLLITALFLTLGIFAQDSTLYVIEDFAVEGNRRTKDWIVIKECGFEKGDTVSLTQVTKELRTNVLNQQLFAQVEVSPVILPDQRILVLINVSERWYIYPAPILELAEPNFNVWWRNRKDSRTNYGFRIDDFNFRGRNERLSAIFKFGYTRQFAFRYSTPYIFKDRDWGLFVTGDFNENDEVTTGSIDNERIFYEGGDEKTRSEYSGKIGVTKRPSVYDRHAFQLNYRQVEVEDSLLSIHPDYFLGTSSELSFLGLAYSYAHTDVDRRGYPLKGHSYSLRLEKKGLGLIEGAPDITEAYLDYRLYNPVGKRWHSQHMISLKTTYEQGLPYYLQRGLGYGNRSVRSYEYFIMDGQHYVLGRNNLKFSVIPEKAIPFTENFHRLIRDFRFGVFVNLIADIGYVQDDLYGALNPRSNDLLFGTGLGIDFVTNYDMVFRIETTIHQDGRPGLFLHYSKSI